MPPPLCEAIPSVPRDFSDLVGQMLAKPVHARPASASDVARALRQIAESPVGATVTPPRAVSTPRQAARPRLPEVERLVRSLGCAGPPGRPTSAPTRGAGGARRHESRSRGTARSSRTSSARPTADRDPGDTLHHQQPSHAGQRARVPGVGGVQKILGHPDEAVAFARKAVALATDVAAYWNALGDVLLAAGRNAEAVDALKRAIALASGYLPAIERLELAYVRLGDAQLALDLRVSRLRMADQAARAETLERAPARRRRRTRS